MNTDLLIKEFTEGKVLLFNKPLYWSSFDLIKKVKQVLRSQLQLKKIKIGHAGTLDPLATGLMIICTGKETKNIEVYQAASKEYVARIRLGMTTPSFDLETDPDKEYAIHHITRELVETVLQNFTGEQLQMPPRFSAKSIGGKRAYHYARRGENIELTANKIVVHMLQLISFNLPFLEVSISCSKGTYIRALARDIGAGLDSGAHLTGLVRTRIGEFTIKDALMIEDFERNLVLL